jgi:hypothetical protein
LLNSSTRSATHFVLSRLRSAAFPPIEAETDILTDEVAAASRSIGREVLSHLGSRFHRIYHAI